MRRAFLLASVVGIAAMPFAAEAQTAFNWAGFYAGLHGGLLHGDVAIDDNGPFTGSIQGGIFGALAGVNGAVSPNLVWSLEADAGFGDLRGTGENEPPSPDGISDFLYDFDWDLHLRLRAGVPVGSALGFIAIGLAVAQLHVSEYGQQSQGGLYAGGTIGGGVDFMLTPKLTGRLEALRDVFQPVSYGDYTVNFSSWTARAALIWRLP